MMKMRVMAVMAMRSSILTRTLMVVTVMVSIILGGQRALHKQTK